MSERPNEDLDLSQNFHGLFEPTDKSPPDYQPKNFVRIAVFRNSAIGWVKAPHEFHPAELRNTEELYDMFGGGFYEVWARDEKGKIYTKALHRIDGPCKPMAPKAVGSDGKTVHNATDDAANGAGAAAPGVGPGGRAPPPGMDAWQWYQMERDREDRQREREEAREQRRLDAERADRQAQIQMQTMTVMIQAIATMGGSKESSAELMKAAADVARLAQPAASPPSSLKEAMELSDLIDKRAASRTPPSPEEPTSAIIEAIAGAVAPLAQAMITKNAGLPPVGP